jgi:organic radical activating enzyme
MRFIKDNTVNNPPLLEQLQNKGYEYLTSKNMLISQFLAQTIQELQNYKDYNQEVYKKIVLKLSPIAKKYVKRLGSIKKKIKLVLVQYQQMVDVVPIIIIKYA